MSLKEIDISYDFRSDAHGKDPDAFSARLRRYHQLLWSKPLSNGKIFDLTEENGAYLYHRSSLGEFFLSSDTAIPTFSKWKRLEEVINQVDPLEIEAFRSICYTIGGMIIFPGNKINGKPTINGARGFNPRIADRFDLTLECIRLFYLERNSPLSSTLSRYADFFLLFENFQGYVDFFFLQDLVREDLRIKFFIPFKDFESPSYPKNLDEYLEYRSQSINFVNERNNRIRGITIYGEDNNYSNSKI